MESISGSDEASVAQRFEVAAEAANLPHLAAARVSGFGVLLGGLCTAATAAALNLIVRSEWNVLLLILLLAPTLVPAVIAVNARLTRRRYGIAPRREDAPEAVAKFRRRATLATLPSEVAVLAVAVFMPFVFAVITAFVMGATTIYLVWRAYGRAVVRMSVEPN